METLSWDDIPSIENAEVDWDHEPENPMGKRSHVRVNTKKLSLCFDQKSFPVNISSSKQYATGALVDISQSGLAVLLNDTDLKNGLRTKISLNISDQKMISKAVVRNFFPYRGQIRVGFEFDTLAKENLEYIKGLISSRAYCL